MTNLVNIRIAKADRDIEFDLEALSLDVCTYLLTHGLKQMLNDTHAGVKADDPEAAQKAWSLAVKKADALKAGQVRSAGERTADPVKREALRMASETVLAKWKKAKDERKDDAKAVRTAAKKLIAENGAYMAMAERRVEELKALGMDIDLDDDNDD